MVKEQQGEEDPEGGQARGVAQNFGADDVAVHLLENDDEDDEHQALARVGEQQQQSAGDGAEEGAENGDDVGDAHDDADEHGVGYVQDGQDDAAEDADNQGVQELSGDKAAENLVDGPQVPENRVAGAAFFHQGEEELFPLAHELVPAHKQVDHDDDADGEVQQASGHVHHAGDQVHEGGEGIVLKPVGKGGGDPVGDIDQHPGVLPVGLQKGGELVEGALNHARQASDQLRQVFQQLGHDDGDEQGQHRQQHQGGEGGGQPPGRLFLYVVVEKILLGKPGEGVKQVSHNRTQQNGPQGAENAPQPRGQGAQVEHDLAHKEDHHDSQENQPAVEQDLFNGKFQSRPPFQETRFPGKLGKRIVNFILCHIV